MHTLDAYSIINITVLIIIALQVSFQKAIYSGAEGKVISEIRLKATEFETYFSVQIFATTLNVGSTEKAYEATSGELCVQLVLQPCPVTLCVELKCVLIIIVIAITMHWYLYYV